jgi:hypothetical protein
MTNQNYGISYGDGNQLCNGLQAHNARKVAQQRANDLGKPVWLWESPASEDSGDGERFDPEAPTNTALTADTITDDQIRALQAEALAAGDDTQEDLCRLALGMTPIKAWSLTSYGARIRCAEAVNTAAHAAQDVA